MITCIVQARIGSSRLPGKTMKIITEHKRIIDFVVGQLQSSKLIEKIIIAIPDLIEDDLTYHHLVSKNISVFRGSAKNVLDRYYQCAKITSSSIIVRVTADCPLIDPEIIDNVIQKFIENKFDYVANTHPRTFPYGTETEVFSFNALEKAWMETNDDFDREHVTPYFYKNLDKFTIGNFKQENNQSKYRWTVDYEEDLEFVRFIANNISKNPILTSDIIELIEKNPDIIKINKKYNPDN
ncbi:glycosyltransferase family protein [Nitrosopumilus sp.]|nr:glycosyltransferase family protein [Nitrosopumilus sp.]|tara:strand:+ start:23734 stop:24450 length:717 start_codon:yes stop_codon:yes gene_type:complete